MTQRSDIKDRLHNLMLRPGFQAREDQETLLAAMEEIDRLRTFVRSAEAQRQAGAILTALKGV